MKNFRLLSLVACFFLGFSINCLADNYYSIRFTLSFDKPASHSFHVQMEYEGITDTLTVLKMPVWTPGYYQVMPYADQVINFNAADANGHALIWSREANAWHIQNKKHQKIIVSYDVKAERAFVAANIVEEDRAYISPAGAFLYPKGKISQPVRVMVKPYETWTTIATGLDSIAGGGHAYTAPDYDVLYDSPFLLGKLETLPSFEVKGVPHYFVGYKMGDFDRQQFVADMKKIVESAVAVIGDIPYKHYTFLAIGPGAGGIEHLNSASISFSGQSLSTPAGRKRIYNFLAHEYFHHYNVKRIRPVELGPFDYDKGSRTKMLFVSEGLSVYYEYLVVRRAGLVSDEDVLNALHNNLAAYESKPGRLFQSLAEASYETFSDGPFGRTGDDVNKTISYYDKGPVVGAMLDLAIRHETGNRKSLDEVMRTLYYDYYQKLKRGFTEEEFRKTVSAVAGKPLPELFDYIYTVKAPDYKKYFGYAGLDVDMNPKTVPAYSGIVARERGDSLYTNDVEWESPAWKAGLRRREVILAVDGVPVKTAAAFQQLASQKKTGERIRLQVKKPQGVQELTVVLGEKQEMSFDIKPLSGASAEEIAIGRDWLRGMH
ncbi:M61 family metallopeptidase [Sediminibacterium soli]|uniref:M61 family metallopeptidase n=1 Tax=Sediminibacterium soli TaxID=2698829 RepID=UPI00137B73D3|nr:PDZ domain-containing protein [Sediminibacterium soli]NCI45754.1 M61 family metallopeptidase [Sediminibacterium soli]